MTIRNKIIFTKTPYLKWDYVEKMFLNKKDNKYFIKSKDGTFKPVGKNKNDSQN